MLLGLLVCIVGADTEMGLHFGPFNRLSEKLALHSNLGLHVCASIVMGVVGCLLGSWFGRAQAAARRSESIFDAINTASLPLMLCESEAPYSVLHVNQEFEDLTGYTQVETIGKPCCYLQEDALEENTQATKKTTLAIGRHEGSTLQVNNIRKDGKSIWIELKIMPLRALDGSWSQLVVTLIDVTSRERMARYAEVSNQELIRWRHLFLSRESRNLSLKAEVDQLRVRLGLLPKYAAQELRYSMTRADEI